MLSNFLCRVVVALSLVGSCNWRNRSAGVCTCRSIVLHQVMYASTPAVLFSATLPFFFRDSTSFRFSRYNISIMVYLLSVHRYCKKGERESLSHTTENPEVGRKTTECMLTSTPSPDALGIRLEARMGAHAKKVGSVLAIILRIASKFFV